MAKNAQTQLPEFVKAQLAEAQKRFHALETEAQQALKNLVARGKESREELEAFVRRVNKGELHLPNAESLKELGKRAGDATQILRKRLDELQTKVISTAGVATQEQVKTLSREIGKLTRKVDQLIKGGKPSARA